MKKIFSLIMTAALVMALCGMSVCAGNCHGKKSCGSSSGTKTVYCSKNCTFTDADKDGICDSCGKKCASVCKHTDTDKDGVCDNCGKKCSSGKTSGNAGGSKNGGHHSHH